MPVLVIEQYITLHAEFVPTIFGLISGLKKILLVKNALLAGISAPIWSNPPMAPRET